MTLTVDDLLAGAALTHTVAIPPEVLAPGGHPSAPEEAPPTVVLRPLVLADVARIQKAARGTNELAGVLMVQQAMTEPQVTVDQVSRMHAGLVEFLLGEVNRISGLALSGQELDDAVHAPLARACVVLARHFGWTPQECAALTVGQILLYLEMLARGEAVVTP